MKKPSLKTAFYLASFYSILASATDAMLTDLQEKKQRLFFRLLDSDGDGYISSGDFKSIGENICIMQGLELDTIVFRQIDEANEKLWMDIREYSDQSRRDSCSIEEWLKFADDQIVNCDDVWYDNYINAVVTGLFLLFDSDGDGLISDREFFSIFVSFRVEVRYASSCFRKLDLNNDGHIAREELVIAVKEFLRSDNVEANGNWLFGDWN